ncbi:hypothetical protein IGI04_003124 [Brassica rapa subsp. trilocularis]|uniref:RNase H type-1 domain-containing protein n=1 Tax=Brassica rapa subsp. trilocularis TaxID=1813537 RepID=A0ABQ7NXG8_BRACM|nr:hypothetical protein IGI04_003124 [Brassica rapa subsp. trilocularis]
MNFQVTCISSTSTLCFQGSNSRRHIASALAAEALALYAGLSKETNLWWLLEEYSMTLVACNEPADSMAKSSLF